MKEVMQKERRECFLILPANVARQWFNPAVLYAEILSLSRNGPCIASDAFFAEKYSVGQRTVRYALKSLEIAGLIERKRTGATGREIIIKGEFVTGKNWSNIRQKSAGHAAITCQPNDNDLAVTRQKFAKVTGKDLPNSNISLVNSLSKQALPTDQEIFDYAEQIGLDLDAAERFIRQMEESGWQISGQAVRNWKALLKSRLRWQSEETGGKIENASKPEQRFGIHL